MMRPPPIPSRSGLRRRLGSMAGVLALLGSGAGLAQRASAAAGTTTSAQVTVTGGTAMAPSASTTTGPTTTGTATTTTIGTATTTTGATTTTPSTTSSGTTTVGAPSAVPTGSPAPTGSLVPTGSPVPNTTGLTLPNTGAAAGASGAPSCLSLTASFVHSARKRPRPHTGTTRTGTTPAAHRHACLTVPASRAKRRAHSHASPHTGPGTRSTASHHQPQSAPAPPVANPATLAGTQPGIWTLGVGNGDALDIITALLGGRDNPPKALIPIYRAAAKRYGVPWQVLAAINAVETDYGRDEATSSAGAIGWMQFLPATFSRYAVDADTATKASPYNAKDAIFTAARLLAANGGEQKLRQAVFDYNHSNAYVDQVMYVAQAIGDREHRPDTTTREKLAAMRNTTELLNGTPYVWGGGHGDWSPASGYDCSGFVSAVLHAAGYLSTPQTTQTLISARSIVSGPGRWVTIFDRTDAPVITSDHVIIDIDGQWWESGGGSSDDGSASVHRISHVSSSYLATFNRILHPRGL